MGNKLDSLYSTFGKFANSKSLDTLDQKFSQLQQSATALSSSRTLGTVATGIDKLTMSLNSLSSSQGLPNLVKQLNSFGNAVEKTFGKLGKTASMGIDASGLNSLPKTFTEIMGIAPKIQASFAMLGDEITKTTKLADTFGSSMKAIIQDDLSSPMLQFATSLTDMFKPTGSLYGAMDGLFSDLNKQISKLDTSVGSTLQKLQNLQSGSGNYNVTSSGSGGSGGVPSNFLNLGRLNGAFSLMALATEAAASRINQAVQALSPTRQSMGISSQTGWNQFLNSSSNILSRLNSSQGNIYSYSDYSSALQQAVQGGARTNSQVTSLLPLLMQSSKFGIGMDPALMFQTLKRGGNNSQILNSLLMAGRMQGVNPSAISQTLSSNSSFLTGNFSGRKLTNAERNMIALSSALQASGASPEAGNSFVQQVMYAGNGETIQQMQQQIGMSGANFVNQAQRSVQAGNFVKAYSYLQNAYQAILKSSGGNTTNAMMKLNALGISDPNMLNALGSVNTSGSTFKNTANALLSRSGSSMPNSYAKIASHQTGLLPSVFNGLESTAPVKGIVNFLQNGILGHSISATGITDVGLATLAPFIGMHLGGHSLAGKGAGMLAHGLGSVIGMFTKNGTSGGFLSKIGGFLSGVGGGGLNLPKTGVMRQKATPVYVVNWPGSSLMSSSSNPVTSAIDNTLTSSGGTALRGASFGTSIKKFLFKHGNWGEGVAGKLTRKAYYAATAIEENGISGALKIGMGNFAKGFTSILTKFGNTAFGSVLGKLAGPMGLVADAAMIADNAWKGMKAKNPNTKIKDLGNAIGGTAGALIGTIFFGPLGGAIGGLIGSYLGTAIVFIKNNIGKWASGLAHIGQTAWNWVKGLFGGGPTIPTQGHRVGGPTITSGFGMRQDPFNGSYGFHPGVDIAASSGTSFSTPLSGVVTHTGFNPIYGNHVAVSGVDGLTRIFGHASSLSVHKGQFVGGGATLGRVGSTGRSTGPHLHYEVRNGNKVVNPMGMGGPSYPSTIARWLPQMSQASAMYGVPVPIIAGVMNQESGGNPNAVSSAGALGLMQFMPSTASGLGINPLNPTSAIMGGAKYLSQLYHSLGSWPLALAGYNAGGGAVQSWVSQYGPNWSAISPHLTNGYLQTANYVPAIMGWINAYGGINGKPMAGSASAPTSPTSTSSSSPFAGLWTPSSGNSQSLAQAAILASHGAVASNFQASLSSSIAGMGASGTSKLTTLEDVVDKLASVESQIKKTNQHLEMHTAIHSSINKSLKNAKSSVLVGGKPL